MYQLKIRLIYSKSCKYHRWINRQCYTQCYHV